MAPASPPPRSWCSGRNQFQQPLGVGAGLLARIDDGEAVPVGGRVHAAWPPRSASGSWVQPCSMQTSGTSVSRSTPAGRCISAPPSRAGRARGRRGQSTRAAARRAVWPVGAAGSAGRRTDDGAGKRGAAGAPASAGGGPMTAPGSAAGARRGGPPGASAARVRRRRAAPQGRREPPPGAPPREARPSDRRAWFARVELAPVDGVHGRSLYQAVDRQSEHHRAGSPRRHEAPVDAQERDPVRLAQLGVAEDRAASVSRMPGAPPSSSSSTPARVSSEPSGTSRASGDRPEHAERRLVQPALQLAQVGVRHARALRQLAQREAGRHPRCERRSAPSAASDAFHGIVRHADIFADRRRAPPLAGIGHGSRPGRASRRVARDAPAPVGGAPRADETEHEDGRARPGLRARRSPREHALAGGSAAAGRAGVGPPAAGPSRGRGRRPRGRAARAHRRRAASSAPICASSPSSTTPSSSASRGSAVRPDNDHAVLARRFGERYTRDERLLTALELHDEPYWIWKTGGADGVAALHALLERVPDCRSSCASSSSTRRRPARTAACSRGCARPRAARGGSSPAAWPPEPPFGRGRAAAGAAPHPAVPPWAAACPTARSTCARPVAT